MTPGTGRAGTQWAIGCDRMKSSVKVSILALALALTICASFPGACADSIGQPAPLHRFSAAFYDVFDTEITLIGYAPSQEVFDRAFDKTADIFRRYHRLFDAYHEYDGVMNLCALNRLAPNGPVTVSDELYDFIEWCVALQRSHPGSPVNIAMGSVLSVWHEYREEGVAAPENAKVPDMELLKEAATHTDIDDLILDSQKHTVFYNERELSLDFGAVAKGYTAQLAAEYLLSSEMPSFILNAGGNVCAGQPPADGRTVWGVGIQDPDMAQMGGGLFDVLYLANKSVVTSGDYQRYYIVDGVRYSHLISPETLMPGNRFRAVTVVADDSGLCDYLSTYLFLSTLEDGKALIDSMEGVEAYWILPDRGIEMTEGMKQYAGSAGVTGK